MSHHADNFLICSTFGSGHRTGNILGKIKTMLHPTVNETAAGTTDDGAGGCAGVTRHTYRKVAKVVRRQPQFDSSGIPHNLMPIEIKYHHPDWSRFNQEVQEMCAFLVAYPLLFEFQQHLIEYTRNLVDLGLPDLTERTVPILGAEHIKTSRQGINRPQHLTVKEP